jgi:hypothetical protein
VLSNRSISRVAGYAGGKIITTVGKIMTIGGLLCADHNNPLDAVEWIPGSREGAHRWPRSITANEFGTQPVALELFRVNGRGEICDLSERRIGLRFSIKYVFESSAHQQKARPGRWKHRLKQS